MLQKEAWQPPLMLFEICLCTLFPNLTLERLLSQMNIEKITSRNHLINENLSTAWQIYVSGVSMGRFHNEYTSRCDENWYNSENLQLINKTENLTTRRTHLNIYTYLIHHLKTTLTQMSKKGYSVNIIYIYHKKNIFSLLLLIYEKFSSKMNNCNSCHVAQ